MEAIELVKSAAYVGRFILCTRHNDRTGFSEVHVSQEIEHYFDKDMNELGYIAFVGTGLETVVTSISGRKWDQSFLDKYQILPI